MELLGIILIGSQSETEAQEHVDAEVIAAGSFRLQLLGTSFAMRGQHLLNFVEQLRYKPSALSTYRRLKLKVHNPHQFDQLASQHTNLLHLLLLEQETPHLG